MQVKVGLSGPTLSTPWAQSWFHRPELQFITLNWRDHAKSNWRGRATEWEMKRIPGGPCSQAGQSLLSEQPAV